MADKQLDEELRALKADIANLRADVSDLAGTVQSVAGRKANHVRDSVQSEFNDRREQLRQRFDDVRNRGRKQLDGFEENVSEHPLGSLAAAVGVGFILAKLMDIGGRR